MWEFLRVVKINREKYWNKHIYLNKSEDIYKKNIFLRYL